MRLWQHSWLAVKLGRLIKTVLPRSLLGRSLLMILVPLVLPPCVPGRFFSASHISVVSRRFASSVSGEIAVTIDLLRRYPDAADQAWLLQRVHQKYGLEMDLEPGAILPNTKWENVLGPMDDDLAAALSDDPKLPMFYDWTSDPGSGLIRIQLPNGVLNIEAPRKRLYTTTYYLFILWLIGTAILVFVVAALFMRNQVRAIRRLAVAAEAFGMGRDHGAIKPEGAIEVRQAATAFNRMQSRIGRFLSQRTEMLAGVSH